MSKIGKKNIPIPAGVEMRLEGNAVKVKGPKGELARSFPGGFAIEMQGSDCIIKPPEKLKGDTMALWGTTRAVIANMVKGVTEGFSKTLEFEGIGYRAEATEKELTLFVGFTHPVKFSLPAGTSASVTKNTITVSGLDAEVVGELAARIRRTRPPEPYKGTGIRYQGEIIRRKAGKRLAGAAGA